MTRRQRFTGNRRMAPAIDPPEDRCARDGPLLSRPNIRELLHHSSPPCFYFIIPAPSRGRIAVGAPTHIHARHNSPRKPAATRSPVRRDAVSQRADSVFHLSLTVYLSPIAAAIRYNSTGDFPCDPAAFVHAERHRLRIILESISSLSDISFVISFNSAFVYTCN